jgi:ketopantoate reductase
MYKKSTHSKRLQACVQHVSRRKRKLEVHVTEHDTTTGSFDDDIKGAQWMF